MPIAIRVAVLAFAILYSSPALAQQGQRMLELPGKYVALVIGNDAYPNIPLANAVNDAKAMGSALKDLGFDADVVLNCDLRTMERAVDAFVKKLEPGGIALFFYAGHGIQLSGDNYLVPVNFNAKDEADAKYEAYSASRVQERMEGSGSRINILILDACRNNPFRGSRAAGGGLAAMNTGRGTFIAFATAPGSTASDNPKSGNGLFTGHLVSTLREPGLTLDQLFNRVRQKVYAESGQKQLPWTGSSVIGDFYLRLPAEGAPQAAAPIAAQAPLAPAPAAATSERQSAPATSQQPLEDLEDRKLLLVSRAVTVRKSLQTLEDSQRRSGLNLRADMAASRTRMEQFLDRAETQMKQRDSAGAFKSLEAAEREIEKLEKFLGI
jgi:uncharacterized caspase-like protein